MQAVVSAAQTYINDRFSSWEPLLRAWLLANYVNAPDKNTETGLFGYNGELTTETTAISNYSMDLRPGEGVYSKIDSTGFGEPSNTGNTRHIRYVGVTAGGILSENSRYSGDRLLTFNANADKNGPKEKGILSGTGDSVTKQVPPQTAPEPFPIDLRFLPPDPK
ncbi:MAG: hypothetical protein LBD65_07045 [Spirochaetaceae bacterium]|nr:hypothetical protein [Spirochaetaceae bacterium]